MKHDRNIPLIHIYSFPVYSFVRVHANRSGHLIGLRKHVTANSKNFQYARSQSSCHSRTQSFVRATHVCVCVCIIMYCKHQCKLHWHLPASVAQLVQSMQPNWNWPNGDGRLVTPSRQRNAELGRPSATLACNYKAKKLFLNAL